MSATEGGRGWGEEGGPNGTHPRFLGFIQDQKADSVHAKKNTLEGTTDR